MNITFRDLKADEIECRVSRIHEKGLSLLLYKDARCDQKILDETVGAMNWQNQYSRDNANCVVSIWDDDKKQWIGKENTGKESNTEAEKGLASDSFKRACFNWGIGRELYTAPDIFIASKDCTVKEKNGKKVCCDKFIVSHIKIEEKKIVELAIFNRNRQQEVFTYGVKKSYQQQNIQNSIQQNANDEYVSEADVKLLVKLLKQKNIPQQSIGEQFNVKSLKRLNKSQYDIVLNSLKE